MSGYLGVIDWGIGGLGVYQALKQKSDTPTLYFSDSGHQPYGKTDPKELESRLGEICSFLRDQGAEKITIACNAANAAYADREGVRGIIVHGAEVIKNSGHKQVGLIAGRGTVVSNVYEKYLAGSGVELTQRIAQPLSAHVEAGRLSGEALHDDLAQILGPIADHPAILMACTHYPVLKTEIKRHVSPDCVLLDPAEHLTDWMIKHWDFVTSENVGNVQDKWFTTGNVEQFKISGKQVFSVDIADVRAVTKKFTPI